MDNTQDDQSNTIQRAREAAAQLTKSIPDCLFIEAAREARRQEAEMAFCLDMLKMHRDESAKVGDELAQVAADDLLRMLGADKDDPKGNGYDIHDPARAIAANVVLLMGSLIAHNKEQQIAMAGKMADEQLMAFGGSLKIMQIHWALRRSKGNQTEAAKLAGVTQGRISQIFNGQIAPFFKRHGIMPKSIYNPSEPQPMGKLPSWSKHNDTDNLSNPDAPLPSDYEQDDSPS